MNKVLFYSPGHVIPRQIRENLAVAEVQPVAVRSLDAFSTALASTRPQLCVLHAETPREDFIGILANVKEQRIPSRVIVSVHDGSIDDAVRFTKAGAFDFLVTGGKPSPLVESILRAVTNYSEAGPESSQSGDAASGEAMLIGQSQAICEIRSAINLIARSNTTVLLTGESGTGKEVVAKLLHRQSTRAEKPYVTINCAALPKDVIENELFGHERGAFTGALMKKAGCFELANDGTLLFDEIAEMSMDTQAKLLRAIETQKFRRLGGKDEVAVDVRMIAATNRNVSEAMKSGDLREDLYYRLSVIELHLPPVRERKEDIPLLVDYFFTEFSRRYNKAPQRFSPEAMDILTDYSWSGNVREIRNVVERALVICPHEVITPGYLPDRIVSRPVRQATIQIPVGSSSEQAEKILILETLAAAGYNKAKAARILGVSRKTLHNKLTSFNRSER